MGQSLVLSLRGRSGCGWGRKIGILEILRSKGSDIVADRRRELRQRFLDLSRIVVGLVFVDACYPALGVEALYERGRKNDEL